jgi:hypothetical protein
VELDDVFAGEAEARRKCGRHEHGVVPRDLRQRPRQLLQPSVVRIAAVVDRRVGDELQVERSFGGIGRREGGCTRERFAAQRHRAFGHRGVGDDAIAQRGFPGGVGRGAELRLPEFAHDRVAGA